MRRWYSRPVLFVADLDRASRFFVEQLGFSEAWRHSEDNKAIVAQVERSGCELILSCQWPQKAGAGLIFISLDPADVTSTRRSFEAAGVKVHDGWWGYPIIIVNDPDGNALYFPCSSVTSTQGT